MGITQRMPNGWRGGGGGGDVFAAPSWQHALDAAERAELSTAGARRRGRLEERLATIRDELEDGTGVVRVRGLADPADEVAARVAFEAFAARLGTPVSQTADGARLVEVRDRGFAAGDPRVRGPLTSRALGFHTDRCDVIAFFCVRPAGEGGENEVVSSIAVHELLAARAPDALAVLREPFPYLRHTIDPGNERPWVELPVFSERAGRFAACYLRVLIDRADRDPNAPSLTDAQRAALAALDEAAADPALVARFRLEPGDVLLLNNWITLHRRTAFRDAVDADVSRRRLLLRLWLSMPNSRPLDPRLADHFGRVEAGAVRGGIWPAGAAPWQRADS